MILKTITFILAFLVLVINISERYTDLISHAQREGPSIVGRSGASQPKGSSSSGGQTTKTHVNRMAPTCSRNIPSFRKWTNPGFNSWTVTIDLGLQNHICGVAIAWFNQFGRSYEYTISTSSTGTPYHAVYQGTHLQGLGGIQYSYFYDQLARYVRINVYGNLGNPIMFIDIMNNG